MTLLLASLAHAWQTSCRDAGADCTPGPHAAQTLWGAETAPPIEISEHRALAEAAIAYAGLPAALSEIDGVWVYATGTSLAAALSPPSGVALTSVTPSPWASPGVRQKRGFALAALAELPDFSFSLLDWSTGNETCPLDGVPAGATAADCHAMKLHMGPVNSTHFVPQAPAMYAHYHALALDRMDQCTNLWLDLRSAWDDHLGDELDCGTDAICPESRLYPGPDADGTEDDRVNDFVQQCELEALALEAVGQHYLQDTWSSGHMWGRWGGPYVADQGNAAKGLAVAMLAGTIHGVKALMSSFDDPLCAPDSKVEWVDPVAPGASAAAVGDLFRDTKLEASADYAAQRQRLYDCGGSGFREVYERGPWESGPLGAASGPVTGIDPTSEACTGPRVTNLAMRRGYAVTFNRWIDVVGTDHFANPYSLPSTIYFASILGIVASSSSALGASLTVTEAVQFRLDATKLAARVWLASLADPDGTGVASNTGTWALGSMLGVQPNDAYLAHVPPSTADPALPWDAPAAPWEEVDTSPLVHTFRRAHVAEVCEDVSRADLDALKLRCTDEDLSDAERDAACGSCTELGQVLHRDGCPGLYDEEREPVCALVADLDDDAFLYLATEDGESALDVVDDWCHDRDVSGRPCVTAGVPGTSYQDVECYCTGYFVCYACQSCSTGELPVVAVASDPEGQALTYQWHLDAEVFPAGVAYLLDETAAETTLVGAWSLGMYCYGEFTLDAALSVQVCDPDGNCALGETTGQMACTSHLENYGCGL